MTADNWGRLLFLTGMFIWLALVEALNRRAQRDLDAIRKEQEKLFARMVFMFDSFVALSRALRERDKRTETGERIN